MDAATAADDAGADVLDVDISDPADSVEAAVPFQLPVYRYLRVRGVSDDDALDLTSVAFERAFARRHAFRPRDGSSLATATVEGVAHADRPHVGRRE